MLVARGKRVQLRRKSIALTSANAGLAARIVKPQQEAGYTQL
jgi:hypothetical protein